MKNSIILLFCLLTTISIEGHFEDHTLVVQNLIDSAAKGSTIDGKNKTFYVTALWLKSNLTIKNFHFIAIPTSESDVSVLNIGNDLATNIFNRSKSAVEAYRISSTAVGFENITIKNVTVDGSRSSQDAKEIRDGGKHGISIKGFCNNIRMEDIVVKNCVTDGIAIYRGLNTKLDQNDSLFAASNITIINMLSSNNRRHGGSGDSIKNFYCKNSTFKNNGSDVQGSVTGAKAAVYNEKIYGNGWDMEGYGIGSSLRNIIFDNCIFLENAASGLLFYDIVNQDHKSFSQRQNIKIVNCKLDAGKKNPSGNYALILTSTIEHKSKLKKLYRDIEIKNTTLYGKILLRSVKSVKLTDTNIISSEAIQGLIDCSDTVKYSFTNIRSKINWEIYDGKNIQ